MLRSRRACCRTLLRLLDHFFKALFHFQLVILVVSSFGLEVQKPTEINSTLLATLAGILFLILVVLKKGT